MILKNKTSIKVSLTLLKKWVKQIWKELNLSEADFDLTLVDDEEIRDLNRRFRNKDKPTDVLSFPIQSSLQSRFGKGFLGDVVISLPTTLRQAQEYQKTFEEELAFLVIHGCLHLLGYDHEKSKKEARVMQGLEQKLLLAIGMKDFGA